jgi:hypothetical protein
MTQRNFAPAARVLVLLAVYACSRDQSDARVPTLTPADKATEDATMESDSAAPASPVAAADPREFVSDLPRGIEGGFRVDSAGPADRGAAGVADGPIAAREATPSEPAARALAEADIVQVVGNRLYTLSVVAGLSVIDCSDPKQLKRLGAYRGLSGTPLRMVVRDSLVVVVFASWAHNESDAEGRPQRVQMGEVITFDVTDPKAIQSVSRVEIAGTISQAELKGSLLYLVGSRDGMCWRCDPGQAQGVVTSIDLRDPRQLARVAELTYPITALSSLGLAAPASALFTEARIYLAHLVYADDAASVLGSRVTGSAVHVVDISSADGTMQSGARLDLPDQAISALNEDQNVLHVATHSSQVSLFPSSGSEMTLSVQTFAAQSAQSLTKQGSIEFSGDAFESIRFAGSRAYVVTSARTGGEVQSLFSAAPAQPRNDTLWTVDLSDPIHPRAGSLAMTAVFQLEPHGDRLFALRFDKTAADGVLGVAMLDVSNLAAPKLLSNVSFGGSWLSPRQAPGGGWAFAVSAASGVAARAVFRHE